MKNGWSIKDVKREAFRALKNNFVACFAVCFVMVFIAGQYGGSTQFIASYDMQNVTNLRVSAADKRQVVETMKREGLTPEQADDMFNIGDIAAVKNWEQTYDEYGENSLNAKELTFFHSGNESSNWAIIDNTVSLVSGKDRPITAFVSDKTRRYEQNVSDAFDMVTKEYSPHFQVLNAILAFFSDMTAWDIFVTIGTSLFSILAAVFVSDTLILGERRFFLENRIYRRTNIGRMGFAIKELCLKPLKTLVLMHIYRGLWFFTVVGGFYKTYEYYMIPYILAENPNIETKKAFALSKEMMRGNKWHTFLLNASFLLIEVPVIVGSAAMGFLIFGRDAVIVNALIVYTGLVVARIGFLNAYKTASDAELYIRLRRNVIAEGCEFSEELCDRWLDPEILDEGVEYDTPAGTLTPAEMLLLESYPGAAGFNKEYIGVSGKKMKIRHDYHRSYRFTSVAIVFFSFACIGWLWEVAIHVIEDGELINRGSLHGPWLPIYGVGGTAAVLFLKKWRDKPALSFMIVVICSGIFEYLTSWYFDKYKGLQYWNYHGYFMNINGRICLEGLVVFGFAGLACIYILAPVIDDIAAHIPQRVKNVVAAVLIVLLAVDVIYSFNVPNKGKGITDYCSQVVSVEQFR